VAKLAMLNAAVEYKLHGEAGLKSVADPVGNGFIRGWETFSFEGVERGFKLTSAYTATGLRRSDDFVEKDGPPFLVDRATCR